MSEFVHNLQTSLVIQGTMGIIKILFQKYGGTLETISIAYDVKIGEFLKAAKMQLNIREPCQLILDSTGELLDDSLTFEDIDIKQDDKLIVTPESVLQQFRDCLLIFPELSYKKNKNLKKTRTSSFLVQYILQLQLAGNHKSWSEPPQYTIYLEEFYEDNPEIFFIEYNGWKYQKFENFLRANVSRKLEIFEIQRILREWCNNISLGYRDTIVDI